MGQRGLEDWFYETYRADIERMARRAYRSDFSLQKQGLSEADFVQDVYLLLVRKELKLWIRRFAWQAVQRTIGRWKARRRFRPRSPKPLDGRVSEDVCEGGSPPAAHRWDQVDRLVARERASAIQFANRWKGECR